MADELKGRAYYVRMGVRCGPSSESRNLRILRALDAAPAGLTTAECIAALGENIQPPVMAKNRYAAQLSRLVARGLVEAVREPASPSLARSQRNVWRITGAGRRYIVVQAAAAEQGRQADRVLRDARERLPDATTLIRVVRDQGPAALDSYAPAVDVAIGTADAAAWLGIASNTVYSSRNYQRVNGTMGWPEGNSWTYRELVLHHAAAPRRGGGKMSPQGIALAGQILALLTDKFPAPLSTTDIRDALGIAPAYNNKVLTALERLAGKGQVDKIHPDEVHYRVYWRLHHDPQRGSGSPLG